MYLEPSHLLIYTMSPKKKVTTNYLAYFRFKIKYWNDIFVWVYVGGMFQNESWLSSVRLIDINNKIGKGTIYIYIYG